MKLALSLLRRANPKAFEIQARQAKFKDDDIASAFIFRIWQMEEFPSTTYEILDKEHRQIACKVVFKVEDFVPAIRKAGRHHGERKGTRYSS